MISALLVPVLNNMTIIKMKPFFWVRFLNNVNLLILNIPLTFKQHFSITLQHFQWNVLLISFSLAYINNHPTVVCVFSWWLSYKNIFYVEFVSSLFDLVYCNRLKQASRSVTLLCLLHVIWVTRLDKNMNFNITGALHFHYNNIYKFLPL